MDASGAIKIIDLDQLPDAPETLPRNPTSAKKDLWRILNAFQHSPEYGVYICELFKDPRQNHIDHYWNEVAPMASGIEDIGRGMGKYNTPVTVESQCQFRKLAQTLHSLAARIDHLVSQ